MDLQGVKQMDEQSFGKHYRPIYYNLRIGTKEYAVLDVGLAQQRARIFFNEALELLKLNKISQSQQEHINHCLITATDLGSRDAPYFFALQVLNPDVITHYHLQEVITFLKLAAERGNGEAAYRLASCYAAMGRFPDIEEAGYRYLSQLHARERQRLAEHYFDLALQAKHQEAIEDLIIAYAYGRGYIAKNAERFVNVCEGLVKSGNQAVTLGYGAWLAGMTVEGDEPLSEAIEIPSDETKALDYLLTASKGDSTDLAQHALHLVCLGLINGIWNLKFVSKRLLREAGLSHQLLAYYLAWYSIPLHIRPGTPDLINHYPLTPLAELVEPNEEIAVQYLNSALFGTNEYLSIEAKSLLSQTFGSYYVAEDLALQEV